MKVIHYFGRDDATLTIHTTEPCGNSCAFCVNREYYNLDYSKSVAQQIVPGKVKQLLKKHPIKNVVLSGGEPLLNINYIGILASAVKSVNSQIKFYVNTTFPVMAYDTFVPLFRSWGLALIDGISVSRPADYAEDKNYGFNVPVISSATLKELCKEFNDKFRINIYVGSTTSRYIIEYLIKFWSDCRIVFREDFCKEKANTVHGLSNFQKARYNLINPYIINRCPVCATFGTDFWNVNIHKGLAFTKREFDFDNTHYVEINDLVMSPDGTVCDDWLYSGYTLDDDVRIVTINDAIKDMKHYKTLDGFLTAREKAFNTPWDKAPQDKVKGSVMFYVTGLEKHTVNSSAKSCHKCMGCPELAGGCGGVYVVPSYGGCGNMHYESSYGGCGSTSGCGG